MIDLIPSTSRRQRVVFLLTLLTLALLSAWLALPAFAQGPVPPPGPTLPTITLFSGLTFGGSIVIGLLTSMQQSGKLFGQWALSPTVMTWIGLVLPFVSGFFGYIGGSPGLNVAVFVYALGAGIVNLYGMSATSHAIHALFVVPAHMQSMRDASKGTTSSGGGSGGGGSTMLKPVASTRLRLDLRPLLGPVVAIMVVGIALFVPKNGAPQRLDTVAALHATAAQLEVDRADLDTRAAVAVRRDRDRVGPLVTAEGCGFFQANGTSIGRDLGAIGECIVATIFGVGTFDVNAILAACSGATIADVDQVLAELVDYYVNGPDAGASLPRGAPIRVSAEILAKLKTSAGQAHAMRAGKAG